jgi:2-polyprenyl-3-methyl-5-hydroxy-6-metoxy-1,4-benzoquinol methylase
MIQEYSQWKNWEEKEFGLFSIKDAFYFDALIKKTKKNNNNIKILEVGFGNGEFLGWAKSRNHYIQGVEVQCNLVERAISKNYKAYLSIENVDQNERFDLIVLFDVLEHIQEDKIPRFFNEISRLLANCGAVVIRTPNGSSPLGLANQHGDLTHITVVTAPKLSYWAGNAGLEIGYVGKDLKPLYQGKFSKMIANSVRLLLYVIIEKLIRWVFTPQSKGILSANLLCILYRKP